MDALAQLTASLAGRYAIDREIGRGGMATVYLARDIKHNRRVALKLLNPELGAVLGVERFLAEIQVTANLQHPNLLPLFDSGEAEGLLFYVMPFVDGESLRAKLERERQLAVHEAVHIGVGIASALDYAHRHGVIHRDLKPENILLHEGQPLVADFGIALAVSNAGGERITQTGLSLGTPQYMSPEQATGDRAVDGRSDIYSLGAVLYEALAGEPPHMGGTVQAIIVKVLTEQVPSVRVRRPTVPDHVAAAIECALEKLPADRWANAQDFSVALQGRSATVPSLGTPASIASAQDTRARRAPSSTRSQLIRRGAYVAGALVLLFGVAGLAWSVGRKGVSGSDRTVRLAISLPADRAVAPVLAGPALAISPDGARIAYSGSAPAGTQIYVREMNELTPRSVPGTAGGLYPFFSGDGSSILFYSSRGLGLVSIQGGPSTYVATGQYPGVAPASDHRVIIGGGSLAGLALVSEQGSGATTLITTVDSAAGETSHIWPRALSDNKTVLFTIWTKAGLPEAKIGVVSIDGSNIARLDLPGTSPLGYVDGHIIYVRSDGMLMGAPFDLAQRKLNGPRVQLDVSVAVRGSGTADAALSESGDLVYMTGSLDTQGLLVDTHGGSRIILRDMRSYANPRFSPDGKRVAMTVTDASSTDIWTYELSSGTLTRLTTESGTNDRAEWMPDGKRVLFRTQRGGTYEIWAQPAEGGQAEPVIRMGSSAQEASVSPDGQVAALRVDMGMTRRDVYVAPLNGTGKPTPFAATNFDELMPRFSPDGKWIAYVSDESGQYEVYVRAYPGGSGRRQVSEGGGREPVWAPDGRKVYYRNGPALMAATVAMTPFAVTRREALFEAGYALGPFHQNYDVAPNGREFIMFRGTEAGRQIFVVLNWTAEVRRKLGAH